MLNDIALTVVEQCRGEHPTYVFTYKGKPVGNIYNTAFKRARKHASKIYPNIAKSHVNSWKHTVGKRLRNQALCPEEDRKDLMGHKSGRSMTEHYSVPELTRMHDYVSKITHPPAKRMTLVKNG